VSTRPNWSRALPKPLIILDNGKEFLRLTTLADVRDFLKRTPKERRQFHTWQNVEAQLDRPQPAQTWRKSRSRCRWCCSLSASNIR
jgi:hypothetical protein